jgi:tetratricopeptide (TPR) repeat protein
MKRVFLSFTCVFFLISTSNAQETSVKERKLSATEENQLENAQYLFDQKNYKLALPIFEKLLAKHPSENKIKYFTALSYATRPDKHPLMLQYLTEIYSVNKKADKIEYELAKAHFFNYKFDEASDYISKYASKNKKLGESQQKELDQLSGNIKNAKTFVNKPLNVKITNWGDVINTTASECSPYIDLSDSVLIYTYRGELSTGGLQNAYNEPDKNGVYYEDVFISTRVNGVWTKPEGITAVNSNNNDEALSISYDGKTLFISRDSQEDDGDIYMSKLNGNQWSAPYKLTGGVNSVSWEDNCFLSPDGRTLYFSSSRSGGFGGKDIYKSILQPDSTWGAAQNLGDKINTPEDEDDPFIHLDNKLLLFSSKGHNSMGGYDVFKSYLNPDSTWSVPENMGYPINTPDDDIHYTLSPGGDKGYYSISKPDGFGDNDLYIVEPGITGVMPTMLVVKGSVLFDNKPTESIIEVADGNGAKKYKSNAATGFYQIVLPLGKDYKITWRLDTSMQTEIIEAVNAKEYILKIKDINFKGKKADTLITGTSGEIINTNNNGNEAVEGLSYKIQVAAHRLNRNIDYKKVKAYGKIEKTMVDDMPRFMLNKEYKTFNQVTEALEQVRNIAVSDAFVICNYKGKRLYLYELWKMGVVKEEKK